MIYSIEYLVSTLKSARQAKKLSQRDLADKLGIPQSHISKIENGQVNLTLANFVEFARTLDLEVMLIPIRNVSLIENILASKGSNKGVQETRRAYIPDDFESDEDA